MKENLSELCKTCLGCNRLESAKFQGVMVCEGYHPDRQNQVIEQIELKEVNT
jgi:hypothetical protein